jgi:hypothetical protein
MSIKDLDEKIKEMKNTSFTMKQLLNPSSGIKEEYRTALLQEVEQLDREIAEVEAEENKEKAILGAIAQLRVTISGFEDQLKRVPDSPQSTAVRVPLQMQIAALQTQIAQLEQQLGVGAPAGSSQPQPAAPPKPK